MAGRHSGRVASLLLADHEERFGFVRPSRQLLDFYRNKIAEYENEHDILLKKLGEYTKCHEEEHQLECEVRQRREEISELQKALSDMQVFLFKEREQVLNLYAKNDSYKAREMENKRTVQQLLALRGGAALDGEVSYFFKEPPEQAIIVDQTGYKDSQNLRLKEKSARRGQTAHPPLPNKLKELEKRDQVTLGLQVEALQSQLADQERWAREYVEALNEDKKIKVEEHETRQERDLAKVKVVTEKLHKTQDLLYESTQDILKLRQRWRENEIKWQSEKNSLVLELDKCRGRLNVNRQDHPDLEASYRSTSNDVLTIDSTAKYRLETKKIRAELENTGKMSEMYREQVISLEDEIAAYKEKEHLKTDAYKDKMENMSKRYGIMKTRYEDLEKRRNFEVEGFKNDIKSLRKQLKDMEKQLYKTAVQFGPASVQGSYGDLDLAVLHQVRKTASQSSKLCNRLKGVKERVYELEEDVKHL